jgi:mRNA interferase MazF
VSGARGKKLPVVVVQTDVYHKRLRHAVVAQVTTNLEDKEAPVFLLEAATPEGRAAGIVQDSLFSGYLLARLSEDRLQDVIGKLSDAAMQKVNACLKTALGIG